jgi:hypothetical protein
LGAITHDIVEKGFDASKTETYELSILLGMGSFDYVVLNSQQHLLLWRSYELPDENGTKALEEVVSKDRVLRQSFRNARVGWSTAKQTLIPKRLFQADDLQVYLEQSADLTEGEHARSEEIAGLDIVNVYSLPDTRLGYMREQFPGARHFHLGTALLHEQYRQMSQLDQACVFIHLRGQHLWVSAFDKTGLRFFNAFSYQSAKDFIYFVLLAFEEAGVKPSEAQARISGPLLEASEIYRQMVRYLPNLAFVPQSAYFNYGPQLKEQPAYFFFDLLGLSSL